MCLLIETAVVKTGCLQRFWKGEMKLCQCAWGCLVDFWHGTLFRPLRCDYWRFGNSVAYFSPENRYLCTWNSEYIMQWTTSGFELNSYLMAPQNCAFLCTTLFFQSDAHFLYFTCIQNVNQSHILPQKLIMLQPYDVLYREGKIKVSASVEINKTGILSSALITQIKKSSFPAWKRSVVLGTIIDHRSGIELWE